MTAVLLDLDGTLTDPGEGIERSLRYGLTFIGRDLPASFERSQAIGPPQGLISVFIGFFKGAERCGAPFLLTNS